MLPYVMFMIGMKFFINEVHYHSGYMHVINFVLKQFFRNKAVKFRVCHFTNAIKPYLMFIHYFKQPIQLS